MPWPTINDLPKTFNTLPAAAKTIALAAGNEAIKRLGHTPTPAEEADIVKRVMWGAVKAKFKQGPSGKWVPMAEALEYDELGEAKWPTAKVNDLPDSAFLYIHPDYKSGKNKSKALRKLWYRDETGKIDPSHLRNAAARLPQTTDIPAEERTRIAKKIRGLLDELSEGAGFTDDELLCEVDFTEAEADDERRRFAGVTLITAGKSKNVTPNGPRYYPPSTLREAAPLFDGLKAFIDHAPKHERGKPRSVRDLAGRYDNVTYVEDTATGRPKLKADFEFYPTKDAIDLYEVLKADRTAVDLSIMAGGKARPGRYEGEPVSWVESIRRAASVDIVTGGAAGGGFDYIEEDTSKMAELSDLTAEELRAARPDLVESIRDEAVTEAGNQTDFEEAKRQRKAASDRADKAEKELAEAQVSTATAKRDRLVDEKLEAALAESKLDDDLKKGVKTRAAAKLVSLAEADEKYEIKDDNVTAVLKEELDYIASAGGGPAVKGAASGGGDADKSGLEKLVEAANDIFSENDEAPAKAPAAAKPPEEV